MTHIHRTYEPFAWLRRLPDLTIIPLLIKPGTRWVTWTWTWEPDPPFRVAPTVVYKFGFLPLGIGIGFWQDSDVEGLREEFFDRVAEETLKTEYDRYVAVNGYVEYDDWLDAWNHVVAKGADPEDDLEIQLAMVEGD